MGTREGYGEEREGMGVLIGWGAGDIEGSYGTVLK